MGGTHPDLDRWPTVRLGDVCELRYGKSLPAGRRSGSRYPIFGSNGEVGRHEDALTRGPTVVVGRKGSFGEVQFSEDPCWPIDTTYFIDESATEADLRWLYHLLLVLPLKTMNRAAAIPGLNREDAYDLRVLLPPIDEQRRIAAVLDAADALRAKRRRALAKLGTLAQAIFVSMFGDQAATAVDLADVAEVQGGLQVTAKRKSHPIEIPYLRVANVHRGRLDLAEIKTMRVTERELARTTLEPGDLLIVEGHGNADEIGRVAIWDGSISQCVHQNHLIRARCDQQALRPAFAEAFLNSWVGRRSLLRAANTTSGLNTISTSDVKSVKVPLPSMSEQQRFEAILKETDIHQAKAVRSRAGLDTLFASLQQRAFRGDL
jgi:type I restriction enzyme S subunit